MGGACCLRRVFTVYRSGCSRKDYKEQLGWNRLSKKEIWHREIKCDADEIFREMLGGEEELNPWDSSLCHQFFVRRFFPSGRFPGKFRMVYQCLYTLGGGLCTVVSLGSILGVGESPPTTLSSYFVFIIAMLVVQRRRCIGLTYRLDCVYIAAGFANCKK